MHLWWFLAQAETLPIDDILGPRGVVVLLLIACGWLVRDHLRADKEDRDQRDQLLRITEGLVPTVKELADAQGAANRRAEQRHRSDDP